MEHSRHFIRKTALRRAFLRTISIRSFERFDLRLLQEGEPLEKVDHVTVGRV